MQAASPPATQAPPPTVSVRIPGPDGTDRVITADPAGAYQAAVKQRDELRYQLDQLGERRDEVAREIVGTPSNSEAGQADIAGLKARLGELDAQVVATEKLLAVANERLAQLAGIPGAVVEVPRPPRDRSDEIAAIGIVGTCVLLFPVAIAWARRLWRQAGVPPALPPAVNERMTRMEQALDAIAIEMERMSEGQRFLTKVITDEARPLPVGGSPAREMVARDVAPHRSAQ